MPLLSERCDLPLDPAVMTAQQDSGHESSSIKRKEMRMKRHKAYCSTVMHHALATSLHPLPALHTIPVHDHYIQMEKNIFQTLKLTFTF